MRFAALPPLLLAAGLLISGAHVGAAPGPERHDSNAPIDWSANRIEVQDRAHRAILSGDVQFRQADMTLTADRVTATYSGSLAAAAGEGSGGSPQVTRLDASGGVTVRRPNETARGNYAIYDLDKRLITMVGGVTLDRGGATLHGARMIINLATDQATVDGSAVGAPGTTTSSSGGRVSGTFSVPQHGG